jgi:hypothetical protein
VLGVFRWRDYFFFASRDVWFEVLLSIFIRSTIQWQYIFAGTVLAVWIMFYGVIQSSTPSLLAKSSKFPVTHGNVLLRWTLCLFVITVLQALFLTMYSQTDAVQIVLFLIAYFCLDSFVQLIHPFILTLSLHMRKRTK